MHVQGGVRRCACLTLLAMTAAPGCSGVAGESDSSRDRLQEPAPVAQYVRELTAPGPYHLAAAPGERLVASRAGRTLMLDPRGEIWRELAFGGHVDVDATGNLVIAGELTDGAGKLDAFAAKLDESGRLLWIRHFGTADQERPRAVAFDTRGDVIVMGTGIGTRKLDGDDGRTRWSAPISGSDLALDRSGSALIVGGFLDVLRLGRARYTSDHPAVFVARLEPDGKLSASRAWTAATPVYAHAITADAAGGYVMTGAFRGQVDLGGGTLAWRGSGEPPYEVGYVARYDELGRHVYSRTFDLNDAFSLESDRHGNVFVTGSRSEDDAVLELRMLDAEGRERWRLGGGSIGLGTDAGYGHDLTLDDAGHLYWSVDARFDAPAPPVLVPYALKVAIPP